MKDENLEAWFESIEALLKELGSKIESIEKGNTQKFDQVFEDFINKMKGLKLNVPQQDLSPFVTKLDLVLLEAKRISQPISLDGAKREHYFFFFPDLKAWLDRINRARVAWTLAILLAGSIFGNWYLWENYGGYEDSDLKLRYMRYQSSAELERVVERIDSIWANPVLRTQSIQYIKNYERLTAVERQKKERILQLEKELDSLKTR